MTASTSYEGCWAPLDIHPEHVRLRGGSRRDPASTIPAHVMSTQTARARLCIGGPYDGQQLSDDDPQLRGLVDGKNAAPGDVSLTFGNYIRTERRGQRVLLWRGDDD